MFLMPTERPGAAPGPCPVTAGVFRKLAVAGLLILSPLVVAGELALTTGFEYSSGKYGSRELSTSWYVPLIVRYDQGPLTLKATVPYLRNSGEVSRTPDGVAIPGTGGTQEGLGDVVLSAGHALFEVGSLTVDGVFKLKLPTADADKGLGTGKTDASVQADAIWRAGAVSALASLGWKKYGDPEGLNFRNPVFASVGLSWRVTPEVSIGLFHDWRQRLRPRGSEVSESTLFLSYKLQPEWRLQVYAVKGFVEASPDVAGGMMLSRLF